MVLYHVLYEFPRLYEHLTVSMLFLEPFAIPVDGDPVGELEQLRRLVVVEDVTTAPYLVHF